VVSEPAWRVDSHVHLWDAITDPEALRLMPEALHGAFSATDLERELTASRTAGVILIEAGATSGDLARLRANAAASDRVLGFIGHANPHAPSLDRMLDSLAGDAKFRGVRFRFEGIPADGLDEARILTAARSVMDRGLLLELLVEADHLPAVQSLAGQLPDLRGIVDHLAKPDIRSRDDRATWSLRIRALAHETGLAMKLSVSPRADDLRWLGDRRSGGWTAAEVRPYLMDCLDAFGPDRVAWGSDWPVGALGGGYESVAEVVADALGRLDRDVERQIFGGTARRLYRLES
jgi:L-fuconolactonase